MKLIRIAMNCREYYINEKYIVSIEDYLENSEKDIFFTLITLIDGTEIISEEPIQEFLNELNNK